VFQNRFLIYRLFFAVSFGIPFVFCFDIYAQAAKTVLQGHVPPIVSHLTPTGHLPATRRLDLSIGLPLRNQEALGIFLNGVSDPVSPNYRHYLTPEQFAEQFGPTEEDYQSAANFFRANGFAVTGESPNRVLLNVNGSVADVERVFQVVLRTYRHPSENRNFFAPDVEPSVDASIKILDVSGLTDYPRPHPKSLFQSSQSLTTATKDAITGAFKSGSGSGPAGNYIGNDFRVTYAPGVALTGAGQTVALVQFDGYYVKDITNYESMIGIAASNYVTLTNVLIDGFSGTPTGGASSGEEEVALDIEMVISMSPGISKLFLYEGNPFNFHPNNVLNRIATETSNRANQISCSWGWSGGPDATTEQIFKQMIAQGQTFFNASGDSDAFITNQVDNASLPNQPSASTNIVQVGGTTLLATNPVLETVWNWGVYRGSAYDGDGSSGGISRSNAIPYWQTNISMTANHGSMTKRNIPDVAMTADNIFTKNGNGSASTNVAGTSCAAPLWAGFTALINQQAALNSQPPVGFINPAIYALGKQGNYDAFFHDVTTGNNFWSKSTTNYPAVIGYDLCAGWGTPNGMNLINALAAPDGLNISPGIGFNAFGPVGGPFDANTQVSLTLTNSGASPLNWAVSGIPSWLDVSLSSGTLAGHARATITANLNVAGSNMLAGVYFTNLVFTNLTSHLAQTRLFALQLAQSLPFNGGFERRDFSPWNLIGTGPAINAVDAGSISGMTPHSGVYFAALGQFDGTIAYLLQTLSTVPGQSYLLSFWLRNPSSASGKLFFVNWNTNSISTNRIYTLFNPGAAFNWSNLFFIVIATQTNSVLQIGATNDPEYWGLDDVNVQAIPTPSFRGIALTNNVVTLTWNSLTNIAYRVEFSTNLAATNWFTVGTNIAAGNVLTTTNSAGTNPSRFYRIHQLP
jgi:hypothetical protein